MPGRREETAGREGAEGRSRTRIIMQPLPDNRQHQERRETAMSVTRKLIAAVARVLALLASANAANALGEGQILDA
jgi:hypothetical protein